MHSCASIPALLQHGMLERRPFCAAHDDLAVLRERKQDQAIGAALVAIGVGGYVLGTLNPAVHVSTGTAYSNGGNQSVGGGVISAEASVRVDGWWYGRKVR